MTPENSEARVAARALATTESSPEDSPGTVAPAPVKQAASPYLTVDDVARRHRCSTRSVRELARLNRIPLRRWSGTRRLLFPEAELELWEAGPCELEVVELPRGGRVVRPTTL